MNSVDQNSQLKTLQKKILSINLPHRERLFSELNNISGNDNIKIDEIESFIRQWEDLGNPLDDEMEINTNFQKLVSELKNKLSNNEKTLKETNQTIDQIINNSQKILKSEMSTETLMAWKIMSKQWVTFQQTIEKPIKEKFYKIQAKIDEKVTQFENNQKVLQLESLCSELDELKNKQGLSLSQKQQSFSKLKKTFKELNLHSGKNVPKLREKFSAISSSIQQELGWERWGGSKRKETLVSKMELLVNSKEESNLYTLLQELQKEWKEIGYTSKEDDKLWEQFKIHSDKVFEHIQTTQQEADAQKITLIDEIKALKDNEVNKINTEKIQKIQEEWHKLAKPFKKQQFQTEREFNQHCRVYFDRRREVFKDSKEKQNTNLTEKEKLIESAKRICESGTWQDQLPKIKSLQEQFKKLGPVPKNKSNQIWSDFQEVCSTVFAKKREEDDQQNSELAGHYKEADEILIQMKEQLNNSDCILIAKELNRLEKSLTEVGELPKSKIRVVETRKSKIYKELEQKELSQAKEKEQLQQKASIKKAMLCSKAESYLESESWPLEDEKLNLIKSEWSDIGVCTQEKAIKKRWKKALQLLENGNKEKELSKVQAQYANNQKELELLCVRLENFAGITPKTINPAIAKQLMVNELQAKMGKSKSLSPAEEAQNIQAQINCIGPVSPSEKSGFFDRIDIAVNKLKEK